MSGKILLVDDEPNILQGFKRSLRRAYDVELAVGGPAALEAIAKQGPFAVIVSDMQMPEMSGVELLRQVQSINSQTVRVMLTGNADQKTAVDAVNQGNIFRFLNKPCSTEQLAQALDAGLEQYRLITAEADLLNKTLSGSVQVLTQVLSLVLPNAFGLTHEARKLARHVAGTLGLEPLWQIEMAAMLMHLGCVSLPKETLEQYLSGGELGPADAKLVAETPKMGHALLAAIPRLRAVAKIILAQHDPPEDPTPLASRIIRVIGDYQLFYKYDAGTAFRKLDDSSRYDPVVVDAFAKAISESSSRTEVSVATLRDGMVLAADVTDTSGRLLIAGGLEVHQAMIQKLSCFQESGNEIQEPILVRVCERELASDAMAAAAEISQEIFS